MRGMLLLAACHNFQAVLVCEGGRVGAFRQFVVHFVFAEVDAVAAVQKLQRRVFSKGFVHLVGISMALLVDYSLRLLNGDS